MTNNIGNGSDQREPPASRIERLVREGWMPEEAVDGAVRLWQERLRPGIQLASGEMVTATLDDLYHLIVDDRIWRKPERIERLLMHIFEIRTADQGRRVALSRWDEGGATVVGYAILTADSRVWSVHVVDERRIRKLLRQGDLVWRL